MFKILNKPCPVSEIISIHPNTLENTYHMTMHAHWTCTCWCKQEAERADCLVPEKTIEEGKKMRKSETGYLFTYTNNERMNGTVTESNTEGSHCGIRHSFGVTWGRTHSYKRPNQKAKVCVCAILSKSVVSACPVYKTIMEFSN